MDDDSKTLATESFSHSWVRVTDKRPSSSDDRRDILSSMSTDSDHLFEYNFNFDVTVSETSHALIHADEIFLDGHIKPVYHRSSSSKLLIKTSTSDVSAAASPALSTTHTPYLVKNWRRSYRKMLDKCSGFLCKTLRFSRKANSSSETVPSHGSSYTSAFDRDDRLVNAHYTLKKCRSWSSLPHNTSSPSHCINGDQWCYTESSINEAILYCKRSATTDNQSREMKKHQ